MNKISMPQKGANIIKKDPKKLTKTPNLTDYEKAYKDFSWEKAEKELVSFFDDGSMNAAYNMVDRHVEKGKGDKHALLFESATGKKENYTYKDLQRESNKFANVLSSLDTEKGDRVFIF